MDQKKRINKSSKRDSLLKDVTSDVRFDREKKVSHQRFFKSKKGPKPTIKSIEVSAPKLMGHYTTDIYGKNLVIDGNEGIRVYNLPVERREIQPIDSEDDDKDVVDDWEQLAEDVASSKNKLETVFIPDCFDLDFNLLDGYIPLNEGGNNVSFSGKVRDRTAGMRWLIENRNKFKSESRLFDIDFFAGNGAIRKIMTSQFSAYENVAHIGVILFRGTFYLFDVDFEEEKQTELNNRRSFGGLRFEDFVSRGIDGTKHEPSNGEQNNYADAIKYYNVVRFDFDAFKMLTTGEVDCVIPGSSAAIGKKPKVDDFIEVKTSAPLEDRYDQSRMSQLFRCGKVSTWFAQCILMGVKNVVVGIREEANECETMRVTRTHAFTLEDLRRNSNGFWSKNRCFDDLKKFLNFVKENVTEDNPEIINVFVVKEGVISEPRKTSFAEDCEHLPDFSEVVDKLTST